MSKIHPRIEQMSLLTEGISTLPLTAIHYKHKIIVTEVLSEAWNEIIGLNKINMLKMDEPEITSLLEIQLNKIIGLNPIWGMLVSSVVRGREMVSFDASHLEKKPDLSIIFHGRSANFPLIIECKIIEVSKTVNLYCRDGLSRFIAGEYAWYAKEAMMLAYVKDKSTLSSSLIPQLIKHQKKETDTYSTCKLPASIIKTKLNLKESSHQRSFGYIGGCTSDKPDEICIWHLWLNL